MANLYDAAFSIGALSAQVEDAAQSDALNTTFAHLSNLFQKAIVEVASQR